LQNNTDIQSHECIDQQNNTTDQDH